MPTRKEILEQLSDRVDRLNDGVSDHAEQLGWQVDRFEKTADGFRVSLSDLGESIAQSGDRLSDSIEKGSTKIGDGLIVAGALLFAAAAASNKRQKIDDAATKFSESWNKVAQTFGLIESIVQLQEKHGPLEYDFAAKRSYAQGTNKSDREELINELLHAGIIREIETNGKWLLWLDEDNEVLTNYREQVAVAAQGLLEQQKRLTRSR